MEKMRWSTPLLTVHGSVEHITLQEPKNKTVGDGDDVLVDDQAILEDES